MARTLEEIRASTPRVDGGKVRATTEADIRQHMIEDGEDPDTTVRFFTTPRPGQRGPGRKPSKVAVTLRVDPDTLQAFKATGEGWQTRMNDVLKRGAPDRRKLSAGEG